MTKGFTIRENTWEHELYRSRVLWSFGLVGVLTLVIVVRIVQLQVIEFEHFRTLSEDNRVKVLPVAPTRGLIFDRNGVLIAQNTPTHTLEVIPEAIKDMDAFLSEIRKIIPIENADVERFNALRRKKRKFESLPLRFRLDAGEIARFAVNRHRFPGVDVQAHLTREYPLDALGAHVVGYVGRINEEELQQIDPSNYRATTHIGKTGAEQAFEDLLHGTVGYRHVETNAQGRVLRELERHDPIPGNNIHLTIDVRLQAVAERALGVENGAIVAIDPMTGGVLAFASMPGFDSNLFVDGIDHKSYQGLLSSPNRPLFNRALNGRYPPGSTLKPFVALAGLQHDVEHTRRKTRCRGVFRLPKHKHKYRDWKKGGHGEIDLRQAIVESCDVYFYELSLGLGIDRMHDFLTHFGFGEATGVALKGESDGLFPSREWKRRYRNQPWFPGETLITGIGQGFVLATPLQLASATATLSMRGMRLKPRLLHQRIDSKSGNHLPISTEVVSSVSVDRDSHWDRVLDSMTAVVHGKRGTARRIGAELNFRMAGKTGTAQVINVGQDDKYDEDKIEKKFRDHGLFVGFAPAEAPTIAVAVIVENGGSGSRAAAPLARSVIDFYLNGPPEKPESEDDEKPSKEELMLTRAGQTPNAPATIR